MENEYGEFELTSRITDEIVGFMEDVGVDPGRYEYSYEYAPETSSFSARLTVCGDPVDIDNTLEAFAENRDEFADHMADQFPEIAITLSVHAGIQEDIPGRDHSFILNYDEDADYTGTDDDLDSEDIDSIERQYEEEGLNIVDTMFDESDMDVDLADLPYGACDSEDVDDIDDDDAYLPDDDEDEDVGGIDYSFKPDQDDLEDLWNAFGAPQDE